MPFSARSLRKRGFKRKRGGKSSRVFRLQTPLLTRRHHHGHLAAFELWLKLDLHLFVKLLFHPIQHFHAEMLVGHFTAAEAERDLDLVALLKELRDLFGFNLIIVRVDVRAELDLFQFLGLLLLLSSRFFLLRFVTHLAIVDDLTDRDLLVWRDFNEVHTGFAGSVQGSFYGHFTLFFAFFIDQKDACGTNIAIGARAGRFGALWAAVWSAGYG